MPSATLTLDIEQAARHLALLEPADVAHIFAVLPEAEGCQARPKHYYGRLTELAPRLQWAQGKGCAVFVAVNAMRGRRRRNDEVQRVRALWAERDAPGLPLPLPPSLVIATSPGRCHEYLLTDAAPPDADEARTLNRRLAAHCDSDRAATDPARALRLAGSWNLKRHPFQARIIEDDGCRYALAELRTALPEPPAAELPAYGERCWTPCPATSPDGIHDPVRYIEVVAERLAAELGTAPEGCRNATLNRTAFRLARLGLDASSIAAWLAPTALAIGLGRDETAATIRSAVRGAGR